MYVCRSTVGIEPLISDVDLSIAHPGTYECVTLGTFTDVVKIGYYVARAFAAIGG